MARKRGPDVCPSFACRLTLRFSFSLLLPASLATHDYHAHGRVSHIFTARVVGVPPSSGMVSIFGRRHDAHLIEGKIPYKEDFEAVIARSDKVAADIASGKRTPSPSSSPVLADSAIAFGDEGAVSVTGLYTRRQSFDSRRPGQTDPVSPPLDDDRRSISSFRSNGSGQDGRSESAGWLKGDICVQRFMLVHANPSPTGGISQLDLRKEGFVDGIGSWRFSASAEVVSMGRNLRLTGSSTSLLCSVSVSVSHPPRLNVPFSSAEWSSPKVIRCSHHEHQTILLSLLNRQAGIWYTKSESLKDQEPASLRTT
jgi:hypothetical protein